MGRSVLIGLTLSLMTGGPAALAFVFFSWASVYGPRFWTMAGSELLVLPSVVALLAMPVAAILLLFRRSRPIAAGVSAFACLTLLLTVFGVGVGETIRVRGFAKLARDARPLVVAIAEYAEQHGRPPSSLEELGGDVGLGALPEFDYVTGSVAVEHFDGNPWALSLSTATGVINFDSFIYYPLQNYPKHARGGFVQRIEDWAYVHE